MTCRFSSMLLGWPLLLAALPACALVDAGSHMPLADIREGGLAGSLHHDLGAAIAERPDRIVQFKVWPRKRIGAALEQGEGDVLCLYMPDWLPGPLQWSMPFFPFTEVVISRSSARRPLALADLADQQVGTVLGYVYPEPDGRVAVDDVNRAITQLLHDGGLAKILASYK